MRFRRPEFLDRHPHLETLVIVVVLAALAGSATVGFGLYNVSAQAPHLPPTYWALDTTLTQSVRLRAPPASAVPPDLMDAVRVELGARHFDAACSQCHAAPGEIRTATQREMRPEPPHITQAVEGWQSRHLQWILREGIKMSGMPGWPGRRDDEPWSTVAFLEEVRAGLDADAYAALTATQDGTVFAYCAGCHGTDGVGKLGPYVPRLDILGETYIATSLDAYRNRLRNSGYMQHAASELGEADPAEMARRFGALPVAAVPVSAAPDSDLVAKGETLARAGTLDDPSCAACHGPPAAASANYPNLSGQHERYLAEQLRLWRDGNRGGGPRAHLMTAAAEDLDDEEIAALAAYFASLAPAAPARTR